MIRKILERLGSPAGTKTAPQDGDAQLATALLDKITALRAEWRRDETAADARRAVQLETWTQLDLLRDSPRPDLVATVQQIDVWRAESEQLPAASAEEAGVRELMFRGLASEGQRLLVKLLRAVHRDDLDRSILGAAEAEATEELLRIVRRLREEIAARDRLLEESDAARQRLLKDYERLSVRMDVVRDSQEYVRENWDARLGAVLPRIAYGLTAMVKHLHMIVGAELEREAAAARARGEKISLATLIGMSSQSLAVHGFTVEQLLELPDYWLRRVVFLVGEGNGVYHAVRLHLVNRDWFTVWAEDKFDTQVSLDARPLPWNALATFDRLTLAVGLTAESKEYGLTRGSALLTAEQIADASSQDVKDIL